MVLAVPLAMPPLVYWLVLQCKPLMKLALLLTADRFDPIALARRFIHIGITSLPTGTPPGSSLDGE